jgi:hypothetical protein
MAADSVLLVKRIGQANFEPRSRQASPDLGQVSSRGTFHHIHAGESGVSSTLHNSFDARGDSKSGEISVRGGWNRAKAAAQEAGADVIKRKDP